MNSRKDNYYCGPQSWPQFIRKVLSKYYNRPCRNHDENYSDTSISFDHSEEQFKEEVSRRRGVLRKAWKRKKVPLKDYLIHGLGFGYLMCQFTRAFGRKFKK